jgi:hypothetical protein
MIAFLVDAGKLNGSGFSASIYVKIFGFDIREDVVATGEAQTVPRPASRLTCLGLA